MPVLIAGAALLGLAIGSFLNVVIYRLPQELSLSRPPSQCPNCATAIRRRHNIPLLGWMMLRGRCAQCRSPIAVRYPLVELATGVLFVCVTVQLSSLKQVPALPAYLYFAAAGIALALIDIDCRRLPNAIVLPSYPVIASLLGAAALWQDDGAALFRMGIGGAALFGFYLILAIINPAGMGFGDVKLAGLIGCVLAYLSWSALLVGAFAGFLLGGVAGLAVILSGRGTGKTALPFGPFMISGGFLAIFAVQPIWNAYVSLTTGA